MQYSILYFWPRGRKQGMAPYAFFGYNSAMHNNRRKKILFVFAFIGSLYFLGKYIYFGTLVRDCIYTEQTLPLKPDIETAKVVFINGGTVITEVKATYSCLSISGSVPNHIVRQEKLEVPYRYDDGSEVPAKDIKYINPGDGFELYPVKLVRVKKHGLMTVDSGGGPIDSLILKDGSGNLYMIPIVRFGINSSDYFLKLVTKTGSETILTADSDLALH